MSKYFQKIQVLYKFKSNNKYFYQSLIRYKYFYKYFVCLNLLELNINDLKKIKKNAYILDLHQNIFSSKFIKQVFLKNIFSSFNGNLSMYGTNDKDLFFSILKKINLYYLIGYENYLFYNNEINFILLYNEYNGNFNQIYLIFINTYLINIYVLMYLFFLKIILII